MDHQYSLGPKLTNKLMYVKGVFGLHPFHHAVKNDKRSTPTYTSTAMDQKVAGIRVGVELADSLDEIDKANSVFWNSMIGPTNEVVLNDVQGSTNNLETSQYACMISLAQYAVCCIKDWEKEE